MIDCKTLNLGTSLHSLSVILFSYKVCIKDNIMYFRSILHSGWITHVVTGGKKIEISGYANDCVGSSTPKNVSLVTSE